MSVLGDIVEQVVGGALQEILKKTGTRKRARRRRRALTPSERLKKIEKLLKPDETGPARTADGRFKKTRASRPAKQQTSRRRTVRARSKAKRRGY
ncbi:MAG: hypothetical protein F9K19_23150 [Rhizobiaceae bacterium]|nr:MAG: hypothetical protein F9K19_23150 [Rhizobiaceae bacterium]CAG1015757.1 hypothetical protein RHIZO_05146 [Rhizobiaceae bacterium]